MNTTRLAPGVGLRTRWFRRVLCCLLPTASCLLLSEASAQQKFDARDLTGIWLRSGGDRGLSPKAPPMTAEGEARMAKNVPARGRNPRVRTAANPSESNDPAFACNPKGFPRIVLDSAHDFHETIDTRQGRLLQLWQEERRPREIWKRQRREQVTFGGWYGLFSGLGELACAPMNANPVSKRGG